MKTLLLALLLFPTLALAQTVTLPCPTTVTVTMSDGSTVTVTGSAIICGTATNPPPSVPAPPPSGGSPLPAGYAFIGGEYSRIVVPALGSLAFGNGAAGFYFRAVAPGEIVYCQRDNFMGAPSISSPSCYFKAG